MLKANESFPVINAWVVTYPSAIKGSDYVVPLRVWADTPYGVLAVVANSVKVDGQMRQRRIELMTKTAVLCLGCCCSCPLAAWAGPAERLCRAGHSGQGWRSGQSITP